MMTSSRIVSALALSMFLSTTVGPAFAASCAKTGTWRKGFESSHDGGANEQNFRLEVRNRSSESGMYARLNNRGQTYELERGFDTIKQARYTRKELKQNGGRDITDQIDFYTSDGTQVASCDYRYKVRHENEVMEKGVHHAEIKFIELGCSGRWEVITLACDRAYAPNEHRLKISLTVKNP